MLKSDSAKKIHLTSVDEIFGVSDEGKTVSSTEGVQEIPLSDLYPFKDHPFHVFDDAKMAETVESIRNHGVLVPGIARPRPEGGYEIVAGHRRKHASELAGKKTMPFFVKDLDDDEATIIMVDTNLQREDLLPSEKAFAYKMKLDAMKRQGKREDLTCGQVDHKLDGKKSRDILAEQAGESAKQISRYVRLTELVSDLLKMVDGKKLSFNAAVELSYLKEEEQAVLLDYIEKESAPSLSQAKRLKSFSQDGKLNENAMEAIMTEGQAEPQKVTLPGGKLKKYFPASYTPSQMEDVIIHLLESWKSKGGDSVGQ